MSIGPTGASGAGFQSMGPSGDWQNEMNILTSSQTGINSTLKDLQNKPDIWNPSFYDMGINMLKGELSKAGQSQNATLNNLVSTVTNDIQGALDHSTTTVTIYGEKQTVLDPEAMIPYMEHAQTDIKAVISYWNTQKPS
ncbi:MAG: hypothetical protein SP1CHLAM54_17260 [Chlamydiia bacterium]|nr:hypothetical protein [Chlamydiia bacterium]MCH9616614.1 hypothetical protein [Chlamydiia bacterium]MCH9629344.1 hypothetical protein [Chlamydiia bacterium]